ncbi:MAG: Phosphoribosyl-ATP pyrophosphohydrolase [Alphaproteobacteria bacterium ADurb.Bin438]|nr:MAG: Phosphoribosyl-ATP pyrophosphohydrolase [Alphaproteobacteria bacterium ADurb.Bin438]
MTIYEEKVKEFQEKYGREIDAPISYNLLEMRRRLISEEFKELDVELEKSLMELKGCGTINKETLEHMLKEMADLQYVLSGLAVTFGIKIEQAFERVHESNLSKLGVDGKPIIREDGKVLKGPNYHEPKLTDLVD